MGGNRLDALSQPLQHHDTKSVATILQSQRGDAGSSQSQRVRVAQRCTTSRRTSRGLCRPVLRSHGVCHVLSALCAPVRAGSFAMVSAVPALVPARLCLRPCLRPCHAPEHTHALLRAGPFRTSARRRTRPNWPIARFRRQKSRPLHLRTWSLWRTPFAALQSHARRSRLLLRRRRRRRLWRRRSCGCTE